MELLFSGCVGCTIAIHGDKQPGAKSFLFEGLIPWKLTIRPLPPSFPLRYAPHRTFEFKMPQENLLKSVLVADDDLGFVLWAARILAEAGYSTWPAKTVSDALKWTEELGANFRLLLIDPSLLGAPYLVHGAAKISGAESRVTSESRRP